MTNLEFQINPLAVFNMRQLFHCPPHFTQVFFDIENISFPLMNTYYLTQANQLQKTYSDWIWMNLRGRFYVNWRYVTDARGPLYKNCVAFEQPAEASYFSLMLPSIAAQ